MALELYNYFCYIFQKYLMKSVRFIFHKISYMFSLAGVILGNFWTEDGMMPNWCKNFDSDSFNFIAPASF